MEFSHNFDNSEFKQNEYNQIMTETTKRLVKFNKNDDTHQYLKSLSMNLAMRKAQLIT